MPFSRYPYIYLPRAGAGCRAPRPSTCPRVCVRTGSWTGPPRGKRAPRVAISSTVFGVRGVRALIFRKESCQQTEFGGWGVGFTLLGLGEGIRVWGEDFVVRVEGLGFRFGVQCSGFRV